ncbi:cohesin subunit SA-2 isoform X2 [Drosophila bipectinata]|uniref:cohesin subunit SA-2 isoform X2 n=1 Tax=Drosophila bipectinata TaxID=42026 RepID=UPI001C899AD4|nr:cohesin subunit SA-2 [Drosophila bipectinata]
MSDSSSDSEVAVEMEENRSQSHEDFQDDQPMGAMRAEQSEMGRTLLQLVLDKNQKHENLACLWVNEYMLDSTAALVSFFQFVVEASGSHYTIPKDTHMPFAYRDLVIAATVQFRNVSLYYPMIRKTAASFVKYVGGFGQSLLKAADGTPIFFDNIFLKEITGFVMTCSESKVRPFRHTGTMIGLKMMTTLQELSTLNSGLLQNLWLSMFQVIFVNRCIDVVDDIRLLCLSELGLWLEKYPDSFLRPDHARYLFEGLQDTSSKVRESCLQNILKLSRNEILRPVCLEQGKKLKRLLMNICVQPENELCELALNILTDFCGSSSGFLEEEECRLLEQLMFAANRGLAQAAASFSNQRRKGATDSENLRSLLEFFNENGQYEHTAYLVDALFGTCDLIVDWRLMVQMLLEEQRPQLSKKESSTLIEILYRGVKQAITGEIPPGRYTKNLVRRPTAGSVGLATEILAPVLSKLIEKYSTDSENVKNLLELPQMLDLRSWSKYQVVQLLEQIKEILFTTTGNPVLRMGARTLVHLSLVEASIISEILSNAVTNYKIAFRTWQESYGALYGSSGSSSSTSSSVKSQKVRQSRLLETLRLVSALYGQFDLSGYHLTESVLASLKRVVRESDGSQRDALPLEGRSLYMEVCYFSLSWDLKRARKHEDDELYLVELCAALKKHFEDFLFVTRDLIRDMRNVFLAYESYNYLCDLFVLFGEQLVLSPSPSVNGLTYKPTIEDIRLVETFMMAYIFRDNPSEIVKECNFDELQKKRRVLSGYCKLVAFNVVPSMRASVVFQHYDKFFEPFGDIMRAAMERAVDINCVNYGMTVLHSLLLYYRRIMANYKDDPERVVDSDEFTHLLSLARRLAETFNPSLVENRRGVLTLHRAGIMFVLESVPSDPTSAPKNLIFLRVIQEFVPQILVQDKQNIREFLDGIEEPSLPSCRREMWQPLEEYRSALNQKVRARKSDAMEI